MTDEKRKRVGRWYLNFLDEHEYPNYQFTQAQWDAIADAVRNGEQSGEIYDEEVPDV